MRTFGMQQANGLVRALRKPRPFRFVKLPMLPLWKLVSVLQQRRLHRMRLASLQDPISHRFSIIYLSSAHLLEEQRAQR